MTRAKRYLALDFGVAASAATAGAYSGDRLVLEPVHRFDVQSTAMLSTRFWDFPGMMIHAKRGLGAFARRHGGSLAGIGVSAWGTDFGLLDKTGHLLANPMLARDALPEGTAGNLHRIFPERSLYQRSCVPSREAGTLMRLFLMAQMNSPLLDKAVTMLLMADLAAYFLTGIPVQEFTMAGTSGMYDMESREWSRELVFGAKIPPGMMPEVVAPGTVIGTLLDSVAQECALGQIPVIAPASHGVACAVAAVAAEKNESWAAISLGDRNRVTVELPEPIINDAAFEAEFANLGGVDGSVRLQKTFPGMGLLEGCARSWNIKDGTETTPTDVLRMAEEAGPGRDAVAVGGMDGSAEDASDVPEMLARSLAAAGRNVPESRGETAAVCVNSLVAAMAEAVRMAETVSGRKFDVLHVNGQGADCPSLMQAVADATGTTVRAGLVNAKAAGNVLMQMLALGDIGSLEEGREVIGRSFGAGKEYTPRDTARWDDIFAALYRAG